MLDTPTQIYFCRGIKQNGFYEFLLTFGRCKMPQNRYTQKIFNAIYGIGFGLMIGASAYVCGEILYRLAVLLREILL